MPSEARLCMLGSCFDMTLRDDLKGYDARRDKRGKPLFTCEIKEWKRENVDLTCVSKGLMPNADGNQIYLQGRIPDGGEKLTDTLLSWSSNGIPGMKKFSMRWCDGPCPQ